ncbi:MAG TPA: hypothetical protein VM366_14070 [Anaerolineae bacterium]|nr:hypothetical protein [Anaerolineae bacterium]
MRFLDKLRALFSPQSGSSRLDVAVRCNRCGEVVRTQVDLHNDLSVQYGQGGTYYYWRRDLWDRDRTAVSSRPSWSTPWTQTGE